MASITFYGRDQIEAYNAGGSGIGFYGSSGFGTSVAVGTYQSRTFITDSTGTAQGPEINNCKYLNTSGVVVGQTGSGIHLLELPNYLSTLNVRFTHSSSVQVQNVLMYCYDRVSQNNDPSGVTVQAAEIIHPNTIQDFSGSGDATWVDVHGTTTMSLVSGPGTSGLSPAGTSTSDTRHDWFVALSATPTSVGAKEMAIKVTLEYL